MIYPSENLIPKIPEPLEQKSAPTSGEGGVMAEIDDYVEAYKALHGEEPNVEKRGGWIAIGNSVRDPFPLKVRRSQLPAMIDQLRYLASQRDAKRSGA